MTTLRERHKQAEKIFEAADAKRDAALSELCIIQNALEAARAREARQIEFAEIEALMIHTDPLDNARDLAIENFLAAHREHQRAWQAYDLIEREIALLHRAAHPAPPRN